MLKMNENKSRTWFKVLARDGKPIDGSGESWPIPGNPGKGDPVDFSSVRSRWKFGDKWSELESMHGTWLVGDPKAVYTVNSSQRVFIAEILAPHFHEAPGVIWVPKLRLVREAVDMDLKRYGIYRAFQQAI